MEQFLLHFEPIRRTYTVTELTGRIRSALDEFGDVWVMGEISAVRLASSGHYYFSLKDAASQLKCACFRMSARYLKFKPQDGIAVVARGRLDVYDARGEYQLLVDHLEPQGHGALQLAFEQLKKKLALEGLFDAGRKRPLPKLPQKIGVVTSPDGAALRDVLNVLGRRFPGLHVRIYPALVQGEGSVEQVCRGLDYFSRSQWAQVVILARGGGSMEDLWTFNEEDVARAIAACSVPVISAIGHETDFTIADFVADLRAPTPSAAAEMVICTRDQLLESIAGCRTKLEQNARYRIGAAARSLHERGVDRATTLLHRRISRGFQRLDELERCSADGLRRRLRESGVVRRDLDVRLRAMDLRVRFAEVRRRIAELDRRVVDRGLGLLRGPADKRRDLDARLELAASERIERARTRLEYVAAQLLQLSPLRVLERGYAIVRDGGGRVVKNAADAPDGTELQIRLSTGELAARVTGSTAKT